MKTGSRRALITAAVLGSFIALAAIIIFLARSDMVTTEMAKLMLAALLGLYVGFGLLIAIYLAVRKME